MKALSGIYEKLLANNRVHLMKKLFNLKMAENTSVAQHLNEFNTIANQLSSIEIDFDDEIHALIVLAFLLNSWEAMRMAVSNSTGKEKLKYNDICWGSFFVKSKWKKGSLTQQHKPKRSWQQTENKKH